MPESWFREGREGGEGTPPQTPPQEVRISITEKGPLGLQLAPLADQGTVVLSAGPDKAAAIGKLFSRLIRPGDHGDDRPYVSVTELVRSVSTAGGGTPCCCAMSERF